MPYGVDSLFASRPRERFLTNLSPFSKKRDGYIILETAADSTAASRIINRI